MTRLFVFLGLCVFSLCCTAAFGQQTPRHPVAVDRAYFAALNAQPKHTASNKLSSSTSAMTKNQDPRIVSLPNFTRSFTFGGQVFPYTMVGKDPSKGGRTNIPTQYIPTSVSGYKSNRISWLELSSNSDWESNASNTSKMGTFSRLVILKICRIW